MYKDKDDRNIPRIVLYEDTWVHGWVAFHVVLIKSADSGKLLIIRQDKGADHRYLLELGISRRRLITKLRSRAPLAGIMPTTRGYSCAQLRDGIFRFREESITRGADILVLGTENEQLWKSFHDRKPDVFLLTVVY